MLATEQNRVVLRYDWKQAQKKAAVGLIIPGDERPHWYASPVICRVYCAQWTIVRLRSEEGSLGRW